ncbi:MAG: hypothetical protein IIB38_02590 [Candidatus Hydrogenedentes bacterium]|nr:hypothetical protein [Candidatus Hydrogenedentota bacterium]
MNTASVSSTQTDSDLSDNDASFAITVIRDTYCEARDLIAMQILQLGAAADIRAEGLPVNASMALIDLQLCDADPIDAIPGLAVATENAYQINQDVLEGILRGVTDISEIQESVAIIASISAEVQAAILQNISDTFGIVVSGPFEIVMGSSGTFMPTRILGSSLQEEYLAFDEESIASRSVAEPYSGLYDLDNDGFTNAEEYEIVVVVGGGSLADFARAASGVSPSSGGGGGGGGGGCFIATAAYGTPLAEQIDSLRVFRAKYLLEGAFGAAFVDTYYRMSPPIANLISKSDALRFIVRMLLAPVVVLANLLVTTALPLTDVLLVLAAGGVVIHLRRRRKIKATP